MVLRVHVSFRGCLVYIILKHLVCREEVVPETEARSDRAGVKPVGRMGGVKPCSLTEPGFTQIYILVSDQLGTMRYNVPETLWTAAAWSAKTPWNSDQN